MPKTPTGAKRPADTVSNAVRVAQIATGEVVDNIGKTPGRAIGGRVGGTARAKALSPKKRKEIAEKAAAARWKRR